MQSPKMGKEEKNTFFFDYLQGRETRNTQVLSFAFACRNTYTC